MESSLVLKKRNLTNFWNLFLIIFKSPFVWGTGIVYLFFTFLGFIILFLGNLNNGALFETVLMKKMSFYFMTYVSLFLFLTLLVYYAMRYQRNVGYFTLESESGLSQKTIFFMRVAIMSTVSYIYISMTTLFGIVFSAVDKFNFSISATFFIFPVVGQYLVTLLFIPIVMVIFLLIKNISNIVISIFLFLLIVFMPVISSIILSSTRYYDTLPNLIKEQTQIKLGYQMNKFLQESNKLEAPSKIHDVIVNNLEEYPIYTNPSNQADEFNFSFNKYFASQGNFQTNSYANSLMTLMTGYGLYFNSEHFNLLKGTQLSSIMETLLNSYIQIYGTAFYDDAVVNTLLFDTVHYSNSYNPSRFLDTDSFYFTNKSYDSADVNKQKQVFNQTIQSLINKNSELSNLLKLVKTTFNDYALFGGPVNFYGAESSILYRFFEDLYAVSFDLPLAPTLELFEFNLNQDGGHTEIHDDLDMLNRQYIMYFKNPTFLIINNIIFNLFRYANLNALDNANEFNELLTAQNEQKNDIYNYANIFNYLFTLSDLSFQVPPAIDLLNSSIVTSLPINDIDKASLANIKNNINTSTPTNSKLFFDGVELSQHNKQNYIILTIVLVYLTISAGFLWLSYFIFKKSTIQ